MDTHRSDILNQLAAGQLSPDEAAIRLREPAQARAALNNHWLHIRVTSLESGRPKVHVNLPLSWVELGMKIGLRYHPDLAGIDFNDVIAQVQAGSSGKLIEVEDLEDGQRVEIFVD
jgi:hypothetical protein